MSAYFVGGYTMEKLGLNDIRERYLAFFESKEHLRLNSFSLVPHNDKSILLINAGMTPLKPYFTGVEKPPKNRITTCQKCIRTPDIENVGKTARHGTFFEMLGNFSFGDYFKKEAIPWAWEFFTKVMEIPEEQLYVTVYQEDDEAYDIWENVVGLPKEKIFRMGKEDNFWEHGTGPCGPCSEIFYDRGIEHGCGEENCTVGCDCDRFIEVWNLVFTQFDRKEDGSYEKLESKNIDTGMGLERLACVMQDVDNLFEVDTIQSVLQHVCQIAGVTYKEESKTDISIRVITDHIRSTCMMVCDGVLPSNEGRGYVLRRLLRRAARHGRLIGIQEAFLTKLAATVIESSKGAYPDLEEKREYITKIIGIEEEKFYQTLEQGLKILDDFLKQEVKTLSGENAFKLHDTYGFPLDLTIEIASERGIDVDVDGFNKQMLIQKETARNAGKELDGSAWKEDVLSTTDVVATEFLGYSQSNVEANVLAILNDSGALVNEAKQGEEITLVLDKTSFYAESGGQVGDKGLIVNDEMQFEVQNCTKGSGNRFLHQGMVKLGIVKVGNNVTVQIDERERNSTCRNHTATHILQKALKETLGDHVNQAGSAVSANKLRFDFTHFSALTSEELAQVERKVNEIIAQDLVVNVQVMNIDEAKKLGAMALFGEKYGDTVRVVSVGEYSREFCGGTHMETTAGIGLFKILNETSAASGVRRIEACTGFDSYLYLLENEAVLTQLQKVTKATKANVVIRVEQLMDDNKQLQQQIKQLKQSDAKNMVESICNEQVNVNGANLVAKIVDASDANELREMVDLIKDRISDYIVVLGAVMNDKVSFCAAVDKKLTKQGAHAGKIVKDVAAITGGGGGGRPDMAQAGGKDTTKVEEAIRCVKTIVEQQMA